MPEFFLFLIKVNGSLILFCLAYFLIMRRLTYYKLNRVFLIAGILISTIYPLLDLSFFFKDSPKLILNVQAKLPINLQQTNSGTEIWWLLMLFFWMGVVLTGLKMIIQLFSLYKIHLHSTPSNVNNYAVRLLEGSMSTFSFWNNIYLNPDQHQKEELPAILKHEQVHVKDFHTFDILLAELATVFYWFNPGAWLLRKAIKENVEFITDEKTLKMGVDRKAYQYSMLKASTGLHSSQLITNFNITAAKRRIVMMNSKRTSPLYLFSYLFVLLSIIVAISAFNVIKVEASDNVAQTNIKIVPQQSNLDSNAQGKVSTSDTPQTGTKLNTIKVSKTATPGRSIEMAKTFVDDKEVSPEEVKNIDPENISSINVRKNQGPGNDAMYIYTKPIKN